MLKRMKSEIESRNRIARNIKRLREGAGLTQEQLGVRLGFRKEYAARRVSQYEKIVRTMDDFKSARSPGRATMHKMARVLNVPEVEIYSGPAEKRMEDPGLMGKVIEVVEEQMVKQKKTLAPKKKAAIIMMIYEELLSDRSKMATIKRKARELTDLAT